jgi:uncharacterized membrane protein
MQWFYIQNEQRIGPVDESELFRLAREGKLFPGNLVWNPTMGEQWMPASSVPDLFASAAQIRPPVHVGDTPNSALMRLAVDSLRGQWATAIGVSLLYGFITNGFNFTSKIGSPVWKGISIGLHFLISIFISGPLLFGWCRIFLQIARRQPANFNQFFDGFKFYWKTVGTALLMGLYIFLASIPAILVAIASSVGMVFLHRGAPVPVLLVPFLFLFGVALIPSFIVSLNYSQAFFILSDRPHLSVTASLAQSRHMIFGFRWKKFCLGWRFFGWVLLALLTCGVGFLWLSPYMATANAHFYDDIRGEP